MDAQLSAVVRAWMEPAAFTSPEPTASNSPSFTTPLAASSRTWSLVSPPPPPVHHRQPPEILRDERGVLYGVSPAAFQMSPDDLARAAIAAPVRSPISLDSEEGRVPEASGDADPIAASLTLTVSKSSDCESGELESDVAAGPDASGCESAELESDVAAGTSADDRESEGLESDVAAGPAVPGEPASPSPSQLAIMPWVGPVAPAASIVPWVGPAAAAPAALRALAPPLHAKVKRGPSGPRSAMGKAALELRMPANTLSRILRVYKKHFLPQLFQSGSGIFGHTIRMKVKRRPTRSGERLDVEATPMPDVRRLGLAIRRSARQ